MSPKVALLAALLVVLLGVLLFKGSGKSAPVTASFDLSSTAPLISKFPAIQVMESAEGKLLLQLHLDNHQKAIFDVTFQKDALEGACVNIGDSPSNDGWGGDAGQYSNNAQLSVLGQGGALMIYGNESLKQQTDGSTPATSMLKAEVDFAKPAATVNLEVQDGLVKWNGGRKKEGEIKSPALFALKGQADEKQAGKSDKIIFAAFNRVIANNQSDAHCVASVKVSLQR
jgi:hypothetical protein